MINVEVNTDLNHRNTIDMFHNKVILYNSTVVQLSAIYIIYNNTVINPNMSILPLIQIRRINLIAFNERWNENY